MPLTISRILHAGYVFECEGTRVLFDPIFENPFSRNCHAFPAVAFDRERIRHTRFDAVFISHFHDDHCSFDSLELLARDTTIHLYCVFEELFAILRELGFTDVRPLSLDMEVAVGPVTITPRIAMEAEVDSMFQVRAAGVNVLNVVDSWIDPDTLPALAAHGPWDMVLWPFQTMREIEVLSPSRAQPAPAHLPPEWIVELRALAPRYVVPSSCQFQQEPWSWYNQAFFPISYRQFATEVEAALPGTQVLRLDPSVSVRLAPEGIAPAPPLDWVVPLGAQDVDYDYDPALVPPTTAEIAQRFQPLNETQTARVLAWCRLDLPARYRGLELPEDSYFVQPRTWRLSVYDHTGAESRFHYRVRGDSIALLEEVPASLSWTTELPAARLYGALADGESLTSMYMRINDVRFDPGTERDLEEAELVDDPLIRCLFDNAFGAYQAAQLRRLKGRD